MLTRSVQSFAEPDVGELQRASERRGGSTDASHLLSLTGLNAVVEKMHENILFQNRLLNLKIQETQRKNKTKQVTTSSDCGMWVRFF